VQAIIFAGQIGHPVKPLEQKVPTLRRSTSDETFKGPPTVELSKPTLRRTISAPMTAFELDSAAEMKEKETDFADDSVLIEPNAPLIQSMRRCERKLPSILDHWAIVDVAITQYELVYFDATVFDDMDVVGSQTNSKKRSNVLDALVATDGGKNLRLRDVAAGRKIVGHVDLRKVDLVKVLRCVPHHARDDTMPVHSIESEYWKPSIHIPSDMSDVLASNKRRWDSVQEDVLKIHSTHGVLLLRFFADLELQEFPKKLDVPSHNILAVSWCQTIKNICKGKSMTAIESDSALVEHSSRDQDHTKWSVLRTLVRRRSAQGSGREQTLQTRNSQRQDVAHTAAHATVEPDVTEPRRHNSEGSNTSNSSNSD
jgi:hypothetical protein